MDKLHTQPNNPVFPHASGYGQPDLTKREYFAAMALSGTQAYEFKGCEHPNDVACRAVEIADALIAALNKEVANG